MVLNFSLRMQVLIEVTQGWQFPLEIESTDTIGDIKGRIQVQQQIPREKQILIFGGNALQDGT